MKTRPFLDDTSLWPGVLGLWLLGVGVQLVRLGVGSVMLQRLRRSAHRVEDPMLLGLRDELCEKAGVKAPVLLQSERAPGPFLCGVRRPSIVLPARFSGDFDSSARRAILAHEVAHLKRRDLWWQHGTRLGCALLWPQPLVWWLARRLEEAQEEACDEAVLEAGCAPQDYARCLLDLAEQLQLRPAPRLMGLGVTPSRSALSRRVQAILGFTNRKRISLRVRAAIASGAALCALCSPLLVAAQQVAVVPGAPASGPQTIAQNQEVLCVAFSPDGKLLAQGGFHGEIRIYDGRTYELLRTLHGQSHQIYVLAWSPDGRTLANSFGELWDTATWRVTQRLDFAPQNPKLPYTLFNDSLAWSPDGQLIASGGSFRTVMKRDGAGWKILLREPSGDWIYDFKFSPDGRFLAEGGMNHFNVWNTGVSESRGKLMDVRQSPVRDQTFELLETRWRALARLKVRTTQQKRDMADIAVAVRSMMSKMVGEGGIIEKMAFSPSSESLAVAYAAMAENGGKGKIVVWDTRTWNIRQQFVLAGASASALAWSPDGRLLAGSEGELVSQNHGSQKHLIRIWDSTSGRLISTLAGHTSHIDTLAWSLDGATLVSGGRDNTLRLWPVAGLRASPTQQSK